MRHPRKPTIVFLTAQWSNIGDRIRRGEPPGGVPSVWQIWTECLANGFDVHVFMVMDLEGDCPKETLELGGVRFHWIDRPIRRLTDWLRSKRLQGILKIDWPILQAQMLYHIWRSGLRPDVVYAVRATYSIPAWLWCRLAGARLVLRQYGTWLYYRWFQQPSWAERLRFIFSILPFKIPCDLHIMTNDGTSGDKVARWLGFPMKRFRFWLNGVDKSMRMDGFDAPAFKQQHGMPPDAPMLMTLGRLAYWKRLDRVLDAMPAVLREFPNVRLFILGDGPLRPELEAQAGRLGVTESVTFVGAVGHDQIADYLNATDVYVQAHDLTNLCNTLIEALAAGCCIVTRDVGSTTEVVTDGQNAVILRPGEADDLALATIRLLKDPDERQRLREAAHEHAMRTFQTWDERMQMEVREISRLVRRSRRGHGTGEGQGQGSPPSVAAGAATGPSGSGDG